MKVEELYEQFFDFEFCEPADKAVKEQELNALLTKACEETNKPLYVLKPAILKCYPRYRSERLRKEMPNIPMTMRHQ